MDYTSGKCRMPLKRVRDGSCFLGGWNHFSWHQSVPWINCCSPKKKNQATILSCVRNQCQEFLKAERAGLVYIWWQVWKLIPPEKSAGTKSSHHTAAPQWKTEGGLSYFFSAGPFSPSVPAAAWVDEYNAFTYFHLSFHLQRSRDWIVSVSNVWHLSAAEGLGRQVGVLSGPVLMGTAT